MLFSKIKKDGMILFVLNQLITNACFKPTIANRWEIANKYLSHNTVHIGCNPIHTSLEEDSTEYCGTYRSNHTQDGVVMSIVANVFPKLGFPCVFQS